MRHNFGGEVNRMGHYVNHFLSALRASFPLITVEDLESLDRIAEAARMPQMPWDGDLDNYQPKDAGGITYNRAASCPFFFFFSPLRLSCAPFCLARGIGILIQVGDNREWQTW